MFSTYTWLAAGVLAQALAAHAQTAGSVVEAGNTQVSAMMVCFYLAALLFHCYSIVDWLTPYWLWYSLLDVRWQRRKSIHS